MSTLHEKIREDLTRLSRERGPRTYYIGTDIHNRFKVFCESMDIPMSQAIEYLMLEAIGRGEEEKGATDVRPRE